MELELIYLHLGSLGELISTPIPPGTTRLNLRVDNFDWSHLLPGMLPDSLTRLKIRYKVNSFKGLAQGALPNSLTHLDLFGCSFHSWEGLVPGVLPSSLTFLNLGCNFVENWEGLVPGAFPNSLTHLILGCNFINGWESLTPGILPDSLTYLDLDEGAIRSWEGLVPGALPGSLTHLELDYSSNKFEPIEGMCLPDSLLSGFMDDEYNFSKYIPYVERTKTREKMKKILLDITESAEIRMHRSDNEEVRGWYSREFLEDEVFDSLLENEGRVVRIPS